mgnify:CR=1 FL=1
MAVAHVIRAVMGKTVKPCMEQEEQERYLQQMLLERSGLHWLEITARLELMALEVVAVAALAAAIRVPTRMGLVAVVVDPVELALLHSVQVDYLAETAQTFSCSHLHAHSSIVNLT